MLPVLRYIDFINSTEQISQIISELEDALECKIQTLSPPNDQSGPKLYEAVATFSEGRADFGRI